MSEYEYPNPAPGNDTYTYYAGQSVASSEYRFVPEARKKQKQQARAWIVAAALCGSLLGGAMGAGGVLFVQHLQAEKAEKSRNRTFPT